MRGYIVVFWCTLVSLSGLSQISITDTLQSSTVERLNNGFIVFGFTQKGSILSFTALRYGPNLERISTYQKAIGPNVKPDVDLFHDPPLLEFFLKYPLEQKGYFIRLDENLKEISLASFTSEDFKRIKQKEKKKNLLDFCPLLSGEQGFCNTYLRKNNSLFELAQDSLSVDSAGRPINRRNTRLVIRKYTTKEQRLWSTYSFKWEHEIESHSIKTYKFFLVSSNNVFLYLNDLAARTGGQYIYCLNLQTGDLIYRTRLDVYQYPCIYSNSFYIESKKDLILAINTVKGVKNSSDIVYPIKYSSMNTYAIEKIDSTGKLTGLFGGSADKLNYWWDNRSKKYGPLTKVFKVQKIVVNAEGGISYFSEFMGKNMANTQSKNFQILGIDHFNLNGKYEVNFKDGIGFELSSDEMIKSDLMGNKNDSYSVFYTTIDDIDSLAIADNGVGNIIDYIYDIPSRSQKILAKKTRNYSGRLVDVYYKGFVGFDVIEGQSPGIEAKYFIKSINTLYKFSINKTNSAFKLEEMIW